MTRLILAVGAAAAVTVGGAGVSAAVDQWIEIDSPHFTVVSNAGDRSARDVAWQFEQIRAAIEHGWPWARVDLDRPVVVIAVKDETSMRRLAPRYWEPGNSVRPGSVSATAVDRHYIALRADIRVNGPEGVNPYRQSYWSYTELTLASTFNRRLPFWFSRGLSAVLSNTNITDNEIQFGRPIPSFAAEVRRGVFPLAAFLAMTRASPELSREVERQRFDTQAWALMQYLIFGWPDRDRDARINELARLILSGTPSAQALEQIYGNLATLDASYRRSADEGVTRFRQLTVDMNVPPGNFMVRSLTPVDALVIRAGFHVATNRPIEARAVLNDVRKTAPDSAAAFAVEGTLLDLERKTDAAKAAYEKAVDLGSHDFYAYLRVANLTPRVGANAATLARLRTLLTRAVALNEAYAPSYRALVDVLLQMNQPADALEPSRQAVMLEPAQVYPRILLATVLWRLSEQDAAMKEANTALGLARTDQERRDVQALIDSLKKTPGVFFRRSTSYARSRRPSD